MASTLAQRLREAFRFVGAEALSDPSAWWRDAELLRDLGPALAELHADARPSVVVGIEARGFVLGPLVALALGVGFVEVRKDVHPDDVGERLLRRTTPPDYNGASTVLAMRAKALRPPDRVLVVDDWIDTGAAVTAVHDLVADAEAKWVGVAVIVDAASAETRRRLNVRTLLRESTLPW